MLAMSLEERTERDEVTKQAKYQMLEEPRIIRNV
jgi:hypothetical protein